DDHVGWNGEQRMPDSSKLHHATAAHPVRNHTGKWGQGGDKQQGNHVRSQGLDGGQANDRAQEGVHVGGENVEGQGVQHDKAAQLHNIGTLCLEHLGRAVAELAFFLRTHLLELGRLGQMIPNEEGHNAHGNGQQEDGAPAPIAHGLGTDNRGQTGADPCCQCKRKVCSTGHGPGVGVAFVHGAVFNGVDGGARIFATGRQPLNTADDDQQNRSPDANAFIGWNQTDGGGGPGHQQDGQGQNLLAANAVAQPAKVDAAQGANNKGHQKYGKGGQQARHLVFRGEEVLCDVYGHIAEQGKVKPFNDRTGR